MHQLTDGMQRQLLPHGAKVGEGEGAILLASGQGIGWRPPEFVRGSHPVVAAACDAVRIAAEHAGARERLLKDERLSDTAKAEDIHALDLRFAESMRHAVAQLDERAAGIETASAHALDPPRLEPGDAVGALTDREIREHVRDMPIGEALKLIESNAEVANAILRSPLPLPQALVDHAKRRRTNDLQGSGQFTAVTQGGEIASWARMVVNHAQGALSRAAGRAVQIRSPGPRKAA